MSWEGNNQKTIASPIEYAGLALHSGKEVHIRCLPAEADQGVVFRRTDLVGKPEIKAEPASVVSTKRCTCIGLPETGVEVYTIEHIMSALWSLGIGNIIIEIDNVETPVGDGSALPFVKLLQTAGVKLLNSPRKVWKVKQAIWVKERDMSMVILPFEGFKISYTLDYEHPVIGTQFLEFDQDDNSYFNEIAPARTFGFEREREVLHRRGLALGGSADNAVLIGDQTTINPLRFPDEFVRHKILDVIGDMALNGFIAGHIIAIRSGHYLHVELAKKIKEQIDARGELVYDVY